MHQICCQYRTTAPLQLFHSFHFRRKGVRRCTKQITARHRDQIMSQREKVTMLPPQSPTAASIERSKSLQTVNGAQTLPRARKTAMLRTTRNLSVAQIQQASELFFHVIDHLSMTVVNSILCDLNIIPPAGFNVYDALQSLGVGDDVEHLSVENFLYLVNAVWVAVEEQSTHDAQVRNTFEAMVKLGKRDTVAGVGSGEEEPLQATLPTFSRPPVVNMSPGGEVNNNSMSGLMTVFDPIQYIVGLHAGKGLRNLQLLLSPSQGDPELLHSFIRLGAIDDGAGYRLDSTVLQQKCEGLGMTPSEAMGIVQIFDDDMGGEIDFDEFLQVLRMDLQKLGLEPHVLEQLRRVLHHVQKPAVPSAAVAEKIAPLRRQTQAPDTGTSRTAAQGGAHATNAADGQEDFEPLHLDDDVDDGLGDSLSGGEEHLGRSLFHQISTRRMSIHERSGSIHGMLHLTNPVEFLQRMEEDLMKCRSDLEGMQEHEKEAIRIRRASAVNEMNNNNILAMTGGGTLRGKGHHHHNNLSDDDEGSHHGTTPPSTSQGTRNALTVTNGMSATSCGASVSHARSQISSIVNPSYVYGQPPDRSIYRKAVPSRHLKPLEEYERVKSPRVFQRTGLVQACGFAPCPPLAIPQPPPHVPGSADDPQNTSQRSIPVLKGSPRNAQRAKNAVGADASLPLRLSDDEDLRQSLRKLGEFNEAVEDIVQPRIPSPARSPKLYPSSPQHRGNSRNNIASRSTLASSNSPRTAAKKSENTFAEAAEAPYVLGPVLDRDALLKTQLFERSLSRGETNGTVTAMQLRGRDAMVEGTYSKPFPKHSGLYF